MLPIISILICVRINSSSNAIQINYMWKHKDYLRLINHPIDFDSDRFRYIEINNQILVKDTKPGISLTLIKCSTKELDKDDTRAS